MTFEPKYKNLKIDDEYYYFYADNDSEITHDDVVNELQRAYAEIERLEEEWLTIANIVEATQMQNKIMREAIVDLANRIVFLDYEEFFVKEIERARKALEQVK